MGFRTPVIGVGIGRDSKSSGFKGGIAVGGLHPVVVKAGRKENNRLALTGLDDFAHAGGGAGGPGNNTQDKGFQMAEVSGIALNDQDRLFI